MDRSLDLIPDCRNEVDSAPLTSLDAQFEEVEPLAVLLPLGVDLGLAARVELYVAHSAVVGEVWGSEELVRPVNIVHHKSYSVLKHNAIFSICVFTILSVLSGLSCGPSTKHPFLSKIIRNMYYVHILYFINFS